VKVYLISRGILYERCILYARFYGNSTSRKEAQSHDNSYIYRVDLSVYSNTLAGLHLEEVLWHDFKIRPAMISEPQTPCCVPYLYVG
jgi:hypothetical protein